MKMDFVRVAEDEQDQEPIEIPVEQDGTILLSTVTAQYPGACGLKYRSDRGTWRGLRLVEGRLQFPGEAWEDVLYIVVFPKGASENKRKGEESAGNPAGKTRKLEVKKNQDLVVLGLPWKSTEEELKAYFEQYGEVVFSEVKYHRNTGKSKGFGFVRFADAEVGKKVVAQKHMIGGRACEVKVPDSDSKPEKRRLFVRNLTKDMTETDLRDYFSEFCEVTEVYLPNPHRGFAFVTFADGDVAQELKGKSHIVKGHQVQLNDAEPRGKNRSWDDQGQGQSQGQWGPAGDQGGYGNYQQQGNYGARGGGGGSSGGYGDNKRSQQQGQYSGQRNQQGGMNNQLPMALAAALNQAGWGMLLQGNMGQGGPQQGGPQQGGQAQNGAPATNPAAAAHQGNQDGSLGGGYGMSWSQGGQQGQQDNSGYFSNQKGSW